MVTATDVRVAPSPTFVVEGRLRLEHHSTGTHLDRRFERWRGPRACERGSGAGFSAVHRADRCENIRHSLLGTFTVDSVRRHERQTACRSEWSDAACDGRADYQHTDRRVGRSSFPGSCNRRGLEYRTERARALAGDGPSSWLLVGPVKVAYRDARDGMIGETATDVDHRTAKLSEWRWRTLCGESSRRRSSRSSRCPERPPFRGESVDDRCL